MDECKVILQGILDELKKLNTSNTTIKEGQVFVIAELAQIRSLLGGS